MSSKSTARREATSLSVSGSEFHGPNLGTVGNPEIMAKVLVSRKTTDAGTGRNLSDNSTYQACSIPLDLPGNQGVVGNQCLAGHVV